LNSPGPLISSAEIAAALQASDSCNSLLEQHGNQALLDAAQQFGVLELLWHQHDTTKTDLGTQWKQQYLQSVALNQLRHQAVTKLSASLASTTLQKPVIAFKGYALAYTIYPNPWLRPRADIDLLCFEADAGKVGELLTEFGYSLAERIPGTIISKQQTYLIPLSDGCLFAIDLHWRLSNRQRIAAMLTHQDIIQNAIQIDELGAGLHIPDNIHSLLIACLHRLGHHAEQDNLTWLYDIVLLIRSMTQQELDNCAHIAQQRGCFSILRDCVMASQADFGLLLDAQTQEQWQSFDTRNEQAELYTRKGLSEARYIYDDLKVLSLIDGAKLIREHVFPDAAFVRTSMPDSPNLIHAYCNRILLGARKYLAARK
jgi:hypothetical protein